MAFTAELTSDETTFAMDVRTGLISRQHLRRYLVKSDSASFESSYSAGLSLGINAGDPHPNDNVAICTGLKPVRKATLPPHQAWDVDVNWSTIVADDITATENPLLARVIRSEGTTDQQRYIIRDRNNQIIQDSAGSPFDGGVAVNVKLGTVSFIRNELDGVDYWLGKANTLSGKINSTTYLDGDPGTVMLDVKASEKWYGPTHYWEVNYTFTYDPLGWNPKPVNAGFYYLSSGARKRITEADGTETQEPQPLTTSGAVVPVASRPAAVNFIDVDYYETMNFNDLGLPTT